MMNRWILMLGGCLLPGCAPETQTRLDDFWRSMDPIGHMRSHRERYYPHEQKTGLRMPKEDS